MKLLSKEFASITILVFTLSSTPDLLAQVSAGTTGQTSTINGRPVTARQRYDFQLLYGVALQPGNFWYDSLSGMWGYWGREVAGVLNPGHDFGPLPADASKGDTGVFINGRQLNTVEVAFFQRLVGGPIQRGRVWLDGMTGNFGLEGNSTALGNVANTIKANQARQQSSGRTHRNPDGSWSYVNDMSGNSTISYDGHIYFVK